MKVLSYGLGRSMRYRGVSEAPKKERSKSDCKFGLLLAIRQVNEEQPRMRLTKHRCQLSAPQRLGAVPKLDGDLRLVAWRHEIVAS